MIKKYNHQIKVAVLWEHNGLWLLLVYSASLAFRTEHPKQLGYMRVQGSLFPPPNLKTGVFVRTKTLLTWLFSIVNLRDCPHNHMSL